MGWLRNCEDITTGRGVERYRLDPIDGQCGLRSVRTPVPGAANSFYYIEYRSPDAGHFAGFRDDRDDPARRAVLIHMADESQPQNSVILLSSASNGDGSLAQGTVYNLPGGVSVQLVGIDLETDTATVEVSTPGASGLPTCHDGTELTHDRAGVYGVNCGRGSTSRRRTCPLEAVFSWSGVSCGCVQSASLPSTAAEVGSQRCPLCASRAQESCQAQCTPEIGAREPPMSGAYSGG